MMLSLLEKQYIKRKAKASALTYLNAIEDILGREIQEYVTSKHIVFSWLWDSGGKVPNNFAIIPGINFINAEWAARIVLFPDDADMQNAFHLTKGHEFTHRKDNYFFLDPLKNEKFVYWINEVHVDFGGIVKAYDGKINLALHAMEYKRKSKIREDRIYLHIPFGNEESILLESLILMKN